MVFHNITLSEFKLEVNEPSEDDKFGYVTVHFEESYYGKHGYVAKLMAVENENQDSKYKYTLGREFFEFEQDFTTEQMYGDFTVKVGDIIEVKGGRDGEYGRHLFLITGKLNENGLINGNYVYLGDIDNPKQKKVLFAKIMKYLTGEISADKLANITKEEKDLIEKVQSMQLENENIIDNQNLL